MSNTESELTRIVHNNIRTLLEVRNEHERQKDSSQRLADGITGFVGSMRFVFVHAVLVVLWLVYNSGVFGLPPFDPYPFVGLAMVASVEAIFISTFIMVSQNRLNQLAEKRADLDLQVNLLTEHELTQLIRIVNAMAAKMGIQAKHIVNVEDLMKDVPPEAVLEQLEAQKGEDTK